AEELDPVLLLVLANLSVEERPHVELEEWVATTADGEPGREHGHGHGPPLVGKVAVDDRAAGARRPNGRPIVARGLRRAGLPRSHPRASPPRPWSSHRPAGRPRFRRRSLYRSPAGGAGSADRRRRGAAGR